LKRNISHSLVRALRHVPVFESLSDHDLLQVAGVSANLHWSRGSPVFEEGSPTDGLYIVLSGRVGIFFASEEGEQEVATIDPGEFFGELALLREEMHSKSARAMEESELIVIPKESLQALLASDTLLAKHVTEKMDERLRANEAVQPPSS
jgi:CRP-like cAMP-binding protein